MHWRHYYHLREAVSMKLAEANETRHAAAREMKAIIDRHVDEAMREYVFLGCQVSLDD